MKRKLLKAAVCVVALALVCLIAPVVGPAGEASAEDVIPLTGYKIRDVSKTYGDADPAFTLLDGDGKECDISPLAFIRDPGERPDEYTIRIDETEDNASGYDFSAVSPGTLTIKKRPATVRVNDVSKIYGADDPAFSYGFSFNGLVNGDVVDEETLKFSREEGEDVRKDGGYAIDITEFPVKNGGTNVSGNYDFTFKSGVLTIEKKPVEARSAPMYVQYGDTDLKPVMKKEIEPFYGNVAWYKFHSLNTLDFRSQPVGFEVRFKKGNVDTTETMKKNLDITSVFGIMSVSKKQITVTPLSGNTEVVYGTEADIRYSVEIGGNGSLAPGQKFAGRLSRESASNRDIGEYAVTLGDLRVVGSDGYTDKSPNYDITLAGSASVTVRPKKVTVDFGPGGVSAAYGDPEVSLASFDELLKNQLCYEDGAGVRFVREKAYERDTGKYGIKTADPLGNNYILTLVNAEYVIEKRKITVEPAVTSKTYGDTEPDYGYAVAAGSLVAGETPAIKFTREEGETPGSYGMRLVPVELENYEVRTRKEPFSFEIEKKELTIKGLIAAGKVWDGVPNANLYRTENFALVGIVGEDEVFLADGMNAEYENSDPGDNKPIILKNVRLEGKDRKFYKVADPMLTATITPLEISGGEAGTGVAVMSENGTVIKNGTVLKSVPEVARTRRGFAGEKSGIKLYGVVLARYAVSLTASDGEVYVPDGSVSYKIEIPAKFRKIYGLKVAGRKGGKVVLMNSRLENERLVFSTDEAFDRFEIVTKDESWIAEAAVASSGAALIGAGAAVMARAFRRKRGRR